MWEQLLGLVGDNAGAKAIIDQLKNTAETNAATITSLQTQFDNVKEEKDRYKLGNQLVKQKLGLEKINEEELTARLADLGSKGDKTKELQDLATALAAKDDEISTITKNFEQKFDGMRIDTEITKAMEGASDILSDNPILRNAFREQVSKSVGIVGEGISPYTVVGDQRIPLVKDGNAVSVSDYIKSTLSGKEYDVFRKTKIVDGAGGAGGGSNIPNGTKSSFGGTKAERTSAVADMIAAG